MSTARLIISDSERSANLYYATRFLAPDPFIFIQANGRRILVMSDLELDRARSQASVDEVLSYSEVCERVCKRGVSSPSMADVADEVLRDLEASEVEVPMDFGLGMADALRSRGHTLKPVAEPFYPERMIKSDEEIERLTDSLRITERALAHAVELVSNSEIREDGTLWLSNKPLTSELLRKTMHLLMMEEGCVAQHTIVAGGAHGVDPHNEGSGPLRANEPIVMDVFPQHAHHRYFADITRTIVKGRAPDKVKRMFEAVKHGQDVAYGMIQDGADGANIHRAILDYFEGQGFHTGVQEGRMQGFFHGTGHGVGLEIHEPPRISAKPDTLKAGMVVTVEPGLYYADAGGMRIEDMVVVTQDGCRVLNEAPKILEV